MAETILVVNGGSSSIKFQLFEVDPHDQLQRRLRGQVEGIGTHPRLVANIGSNNLYERSWPQEEVSDVPAALDKLTNFLRSHLEARLPAVVGHRVVHGGPDYAEPTIIDRAILNKLERFIPLAPLHQPHNLAPIRAILERQPHVLQVACFDTAFHRGHPEVADRFAIPEELYLQGIRRYGFHGLSYEYVSQRLRLVAPEVADGRVVVAHLGSGASMCALVGGKSVESTMGFTALDGLPMGTRPGQLDAGVVLYLMSEKGMRAPEIERFLYQDCGLKGLSGISNDVRELLASADPRARLALDHFVYRIALSTGMLASSMGGIDCFVFTAGIGENAASLRQEVARRLSWLGMELSTRANAENALTISRRGSGVLCLIVPTDEERMIASHALRVLRTKAASFKEKIA